MCAISTHNFGASMFVVGKKEISLVLQIPLSAREPGTLVYFADGAWRCRVQASHRRVQELQEQIIVKSAWGHARGIRSDSQGEE